MKATLSNKQKWFNKINLTADDELYVGIDVHKKSYHIALWLNNAPAINFVMPPDNKKVVKMLLKVRIALKCIVYEAGPTGYNLARALQKDKLPVQIIAPSITPRPAGKQTKTDTIDCRKLAKFAAKGLLRKIAIPTRQQEADRQLTRLRQQLVEKLRRVKIQIKSFLLQHGIQEPDGLTSWSGRATTKLKDIQLSNQLKYCLDMLLKELAFLTEKLKELESKLKELFNKKRYTQKIKILKIHPGIGPTIAGQFVTEIFDPKRFKDKTEIGKYVGLCPQIIQSGQKLRDGPILKTGRPQLRCNLVEAAWTWIRKDSHAYKTYCRIKANTGHQNKAVTAMARKLAVNLWKMLCDHKPYIRQA